MILLSLKALILTIHQYQTVNAYKISQIPQSKKSFSHYIQDKFNITEPCAVRQTDPYEIIDIVNSMNNSTSVGIDEVSITIFKNVIYYIAEPLSIVINLCILNGIFLDKMKIAKVCPILKSGPSNEFSNYRPISVLPSFSIICENYHQTFAIIY